MVVESWACLASKTVDFSSVLALTYRAKTDEKLTVLIQMVFEQFDFCVNNLI
jgi:hypothetical protein